MRGLLKRGHCPGVADGGRQIMFNYEIAVRQQTFMVHSGDFEFSFSKTLSHNINNIEGILSPNVPHKFHACNGIMR